MNHFDAANYKLPMTSEEVTVWHLEFSDYDGHFIFDAIPDDDFGRDREVEVYEWIYHCQRNMPELCDIQRSNKLSHVGIKECSVTIAGLFIGNVSFQRTLRRNDKSENDHRISELARRINFYAK